MLKPESSLEGYVSVWNVVKECERNGLNVCLASLKWRIDHGKILGIRDLHDARKRRLIHIEELPNIIAYYSQLEESRNGEYYPLSKLAEDVGLKSKSLHGRAEKLGIETKKIGYGRLITKTEYKKWRIIFGLEQKKERNYVSTGFVGRRWGVSHYVIVNKVKKGKIPAIRNSKRYLISKKKFEEHGGEWREQCGYSNNWEKL